MVLDFVRNCVSVVTNLNMHLRMAYLHSLVVLMLQSICPSLGEAESGERPLIEAT